MTSVDDWAGRLIMDGVGNSALQDHGDRADAASVRQDNDAAGSVAGNGLLRFLNGVGRLPKADAAAIQALAGDAQSVSRGHEIPSETLDAPVVPLLLGGLLHRSLTRPNGAVQIDGFVLPGEVAGLEALVARPHGRYVASVDSRVVTLPFGALQKLSVTRPGFAAVLWRAAGIEIAAGRERLARNSLLGAPARMAHLFCEVCVRAHGGAQADASECAFPVTQELLARALGMTSVHVNRTLQTLRQRGLVELRGGHLSIPDFAALARLAGFTPEYLSLGADPAA